MGVDVNVLVGDRLDAVDDVIIGVFGTLVAVVAEVKVLLQGVDGDKALRDLRMGTFKVRFRLGSERGDGFFDLIRVLVKCLVKDTDVFCGDAKAVPQPFETLLASLIGPNGLRGLCV